MRNRNRITAIKPGAKRPVARSETTCAPYLADLTANCYILDLDPSACVPLCLVREIILNAVAKVKVLLTGKSKSPSVLLPGFISGSPTSMVIPLVDELEYLLHDYWMKICGTKEEALLKISAHEKWFGIIDGCHVHAGIMDLRVEVPSEWEEFTWKVTVLRNTFQSTNINMLRRLARALNERNKAIYTYDVTVYDLLNGLRLEHDLLLQERRKEGKKTAITSREVAQRYDGNDHERNTSVRQAANVALKLSRRTIEAIGEVVNSQHADLIVQSSELNEHSLKTSDEVLGHQDCRLFKTFVCFGALRSAISFLKAIETEDEEAQVNTIYRIRHHCELNTYKPVQSKAITEQFDFAKQALKEESVFLKAIGEDKWPQHMETARENLHRTTLCDKQLESNRGNDGDVLPCLWTVYKSLYPAKARAIENGQVEEGPDDRSAEGPTEDEQRNDDEVLPDAPDGPGDGPSPEQLEELRLIKLQEAANSNLKDAGIENFTMPLAQFSSMTWSPSTKHMDLVFSCITDVEDTDFMDNLPSFCKLVLNPGSYVFLITTVKQFASLQDPFKGQGFKVSEHPYNIVYDTSTVQRRVISDFPQKHTDIALICRSPGERPDGFHPYRSGETSSSDDEVEDQGNDLPSEVGHFASLLNVSTCRSKLTKPNSKSALYTWEKNVDLVSRIVQTFCPFKGTVIYPYPGALSTAIACMKTKRACISISPEDERLDFALGRLRVHASDNGTLKELEQYSRQINRNNEINENEDAPTFRTPAKRLLPSSESDSELDGEYVDASETIGSPHNTNLEQTAGNENMSPSTPTTTINDSTDKSPVPSPAKRSRLEIDSLGSAAEALLDMGR